MVVLLFVGKNHALNNKCACVTVWNFIRLDLEHYSRIHDEIISKFTGSRQKAKTFSTRSVGIAHRLSRLTVIKSQEAKKLIYSVWLKIAIKLINLHLGFIS